MWLNYEKTEAEGFYSEKTRNKGSGPPGSTGGSSLRWRGLLCKLETFLFLVVIAADTVPGWQVALCLLRAVSPS